MHRQFTNTAVGVEVTTMASFMEMENTTDSQAKEGHPPTQVTDISDQPSLATYKTDALYMADIIKISTPSNSEK